MASNTLPVGQYLAALHARHQANRNGHLASYIPELTRVDPDLFGIAFVTMDGFVYETGDAAAEFTIQSISKALIYGLALEDHGRDEVLKKIGVEPSGEAFNSIAFDEKNNRPFNPMVNAGAIAATALVKGADPEERWSRILDKFRMFAGRDLRLDEPVYRSEKATGHRNRAIAFLELNSGMIDGDVDAHLDLYFRQCSLLVNTVDLAVIGATLANGGVNPVSGERALAPEHVRAVLSVMNTCGMYDYAGGWQFDVGLPAKSGVGGGICAVLPGYLGIGTFSPRLDEVGNSERGVHVCEDVSRIFRLHLFEERGAGRIPIRGVYRGTEIRSKRVRQPREIEILDHHGYLIAVCELQGELNFVEAERVTRRIIEQASGLEFLVLDLTRLGGMDAIAADLLDSLRQLLADRRISVALTGAEDRLRQFGPGLHHFPTVDAALEHFENELVARVTGETSGAGPVPLASFGLFSDWSEDDVAALSEHLIEVTFAAGDRLIVTDAPARSLFFLTQGTVDVEVPVGAGTMRRVSTIDAGNLFGELALFGESRRTADVVATTPCRVLKLDGADLARIAETSPRLHGKLALAVGRSLSDRLRRANREIQALAR